MIHTLEKSISDLNNQKVEAQSAEDIVAEARPTLGWEEVKIDLYCPDHGVREVERTFTSLGCPYTEPLPNPLVANTKPAPPAVKRMEARRAIRLARVQQGKETWRGMSKTERAGVARQLVLNERAIAALPPMVPGPRSKAARNTAPIVAKDALVPRGAQTERVVRRVRPVVVPLRRRHRGARAAEAQPT